MFRGRWKHRKGASKALVVHDDVSEGMDVGNSEVTSPRSIKAASERGAERLPTIFDGINPALVTTAPPGTLNPGRAFSTFMSSRRGKSSRQDAAGGGGRSRAPSVAGSTLTGFSAHTRSVAQTGVSRTIAEKPTGNVGHTTLLVGIEAQAREVAVASLCSLDGAFYRENRTRPGLCNIQLKAKRATAEDLEQFPARLALADAMKHILWVADNYDSLEREFPNHPWNAVMTVETGLDVSQELLDRLVSSLYFRSILVSADSVEALLHVTDILQMPVVTEALAAYIKADLIPKHPVACHELGTFVYPQLNLEEAVLHWFRQLQWDGAISQAMLQSMGTVLERCNDDNALRFIKSLTEPPSLISPLQAAAMSTELPPLKREKLLEGLDLKDLSMADVQSLLHWANNRRTNRAVLADSPILWNLLFKNISSSLLPLEHLQQQLGPKAAEMKLWDLPLAHIPPRPGAYRTRRSGWMHLSRGRSFCMEAVYTKDERGAEWGLFCNPDRQHAFLPRYIIKLCAIQQGTKVPRIELSPAIKPDGNKKLGLGMGFDEILSKWAASPELVWHKNGEPYLTLGLYVDLNEDDLSAEALALEDGPMFGQTDPKEPDASPTKSRKDRQQLDPSLHDSITDVRLPEIEADITFRTPQGTKAAWLKAPRPKMANGVPVISPFARTDNADIAFAKV